MTAVYNQAGVKFLYPENWELADESSRTLPRVISVTSPTGGFWALHVYKSSAEPRELADEVLRSMAQEYDSLESEEVTEQIDIAQAVGYDLDFYCLDLVARASVRAFRQGSRTYLVLAQAESRDFETLAEVFRAITVSLLAPAKRPGTRPPVG